jgi:hypothetical protein
MPRTNDRLGPRRTNKPTHAVAAEQTNKQIPSQQHKQTNKSRRSRSAQRRSGRATGASDEVQRGSEPLRRECPEWNTARCQPRLRLLPAPHRTRCAAQPIAASKSFRLPPTLGPHGPARLQPAPVSTLGKRRCAKAHQPEPLLRVAVQLVRDRIGRRAERRRAVDRRAEPPLDQPCSAHPLNTLACLRRQPRRGRGERRAGRARVDAPALSEQTASEPTAS